jgi:hypothetical protein
MEDLSYSRQSRQRRLIAKTLIFLTFLLMQKPIRVLGESPTGLGGAPETYEEIIRSLRTTEYQTVVETKSPAILTLHDLASGQKAWREAIHCMRVDLKYRYQRVFETTSDLASIKAGRGARSDLQGHLVFAMKGDKRLLESTVIQPLPAGIKMNREKVVYEAAFGHGSAPQFRVAFDGQEYRRYESTNRAGIIEPTKKPALENEATVYFEALFVPVIDAMSPARQTDWNIEVALNSPNYYRLLPTLESVDGHLCHVVTSGWDTFWIDPTEGFGVLRRVHLRRKTPKDPGELSYVQICKDFVDAGKHVWLPQKTIQLAYTTYDQPLKDRGKLHWLKAVDAQPHVEDLPDSLFQIVFPPGTQVFDYTKKLQYLIPRGEVALDQAIAGAKPLVVQATQGNHRLVRQQPVVPHKSAPILLWCNGAFLMAAVVVFVVRWRRRGLAANASGNGSENRGRGQL